MSDAYTPEFEAFCDEQGFDYGSEYPDDKNEVHAAWVTWQKFAARCNDTEPVAPIGDDARDAARYRWLRDQNKRMHYTTDWAPDKPVDMIQMDIPVNGDPVFTKEGHFDFALELDRAIDALLAAVAAQGDKS